MTQKKLICPECEDEKLVEASTSPVKVTIKGETFSVPIQLYRCLECGSQIEDPQNPQDELDLAYRQYRTQHNLLQPEQIKSLRTQYGLTQTELATLLGFSPATISRYENGELQEKAQDNALGLLKDPIKVLELLNANSASLDKNRCVEISQKIKEQLEYNPYQGIVKSLELLGETEFTGFNNFDVRKYAAVVQQLILQCPKKRVSKTKLNKLLFYTDFGFFKINKKSITGIPYIKDHYGPCPLHSQSLLEMLQTNGNVDICEFGEAEMVSVGANKVAWDFAETESKFILKIAKKLGHLKGKDLTEISHKEKAWTVPALKAQISYEFGGYLRGV